MISRVFYATQWEANHFCEHKQYPYIAARACLNYVQEECDAPSQIQLGSMDATFCVLLNIALWLEVYQQSKPGGQLIHMHLHSLATGEFQMVGRIKTKGTMFWRDLFYDPKLDIKINGVLGLS